MIYEVWAKTPFPHRIGRTYATQGLADQQMRMLILGGKFAVADLFIRVRPQDPVRRTRRWPGEPGTQ